MFIQKNNNEPSLRAAYVDLYDAIEPGVREQFTFKAYKKITPIGNFYQVGVQSHIAAGAAGGATVGAIGGGVVGMLGTPIGSLLGAATLGSLGGFLGSAGGAALGAINTTGYMLADFYGWKEQNTFDAYRREVMSILLDEQELLAFICPITNTLVWNPVCLYTNEGKNKHTFNRPQIEEWIENHGTNPVTQEEVTIADLHVDDDQHARQHEVLCRVIERHKIHIPKEMKSLRNTLDHIATMYSEKNIRKNPDMVGTSDPSKLIRLPTTAIHYDTTD